MRLQCDEAKTKVKIRVTGKVSDTTRVGNTVLLDEIYPPLHREILEEVWPVIDRQIFLEDNLD